ncbi:MAG TPA: NAD(P)/FAD-dependent oxidoreductase [Dehalococcoidia bacterium]|jgi:phytoene dehydrogenase-like protein
MKSDVVIIGGGIAGLATGALLAKSGRKATVLEKGNQPGGRAYAYVDKGFTLNYGPHAMFRPHTGILSEILTRLGRPSIAAPYPDPTRSYWKLGDRFAPIGSKPHQVLTTSLFSLSSKVAFGRVMLKVRSANLDRLGDLTWGAWVDRETRDPSVRAFLGALATVNTYCRPSGELAATYVIGHVQRNAFAKDYVGYMSGGWKTMYDAFIDELRAGGGDVVTGARVERLEMEGDRVVAAIAGGVRHEASSFVCALPPQDAPEIATAGTPLASELSRWSNMQDVRATCIDLGFSRRIRTDLTFVYEVERDLYYSLHSEVTPDLAPEGAQLLHAMAYLSAEESADDRLAEARRQELLGGLDRHFSGWRDAVAVERTLPNVRVASARRTPDQFGANAVPLRSSSASNLYFAGDARDLPHAVGLGSLSSALEVADAIASTHVTSATAKRERAVA